MHGQPHVRLTINSVCVSHLGLVSEGQYQLTIEIIVFLGEFNLSFRATEFVHILLLNIDTVFISKGILCHFPPPSATSVLKVAGSVPSGVIGIFH